MKPLNHHGIRPGIGGLTNNTAVSNRNDSGILEERGESTCSSKNPINVLSEGIHTQSSMYPRLKDPNQDGNRKSCEIIHTNGSANERLEGTEELKMPPVSSAIAQKRQRKLTSQESGVIGGGSTSKIRGKVGISVQNQSNFANQKANLAAPHITESQRRIRAILDKNSVGSGNPVAINDMDELGSYNVKNGPVT